MGSKAVKTLGKAVTDRALGLGPGPFRAAVAATIAGAATAALTYKVLRSDSLGDGGSD
jgi:ABC-type uncharacterized transport system permease subunit